MVELIVLVGCIGSGAACTTSLEAYYHYDTPLTRQVNHVKDKVKDYYTENVYLQTTAPIIGFIIEEKATIKLSRNWAAKIGQDYNGLSFSIGF